MLLYFVASATLATSALQGSVGSWVVVGDTGCRVIVSQGGRMGRRRRYGMVWYGMVKKKFRGWMGSVTWDDTFLGLSGLNSFVGRDTRMGEAQSQQETNSSLFEAETKRTNERTRKYKLLFFFVTDVKGVAGECGCVCGRVDETNGSKRNQSINQSINKTVLRCCPSCGI